MGKNSLWTMDVKEKRESWHRRTVGQGDTNGSKGDGRGKHTIQHIRHEVKHKATERTRRDPIPFQVYNE